MYVASSKNLGNTSPNYVYHSFVWSKETIDCSIVNPGMHDKISTLMAMLNIRNKQLLQNAKLRLSPEIYISLFP